MSGHPEEEALLQGIRAHPEEDAPRLVYADWLDEHGGEGERARAELIRAQCALARLGPTDPRWPTLAARERGLLLEHEGEWTAFLGGAARGWSFRRGFLEGVTLHRHPQPTQLERVFEPGTVRTLRFEGSCRFLAPVGYAPGMDALEELDLRRSPLSAPDMRALLASPLVLRLRRLDLSNCDLSRKALRLLVQSSLWGRLTAIDLSSVRLGDDGLRLLFRTAAVPRLTDLDLRTCSLGPESALLLAATPDLAGLRSLRLSHNALDPGGLDHLTGSPVFARLERLELGGTGVDAPGLRGLAGATFAPGLRALDVSSNFAPLADGLALLGSPALARLEELHLGTQDFGDLERLQELAPPPGAAGVKLDAYTPHMDPGEGHLLFRSPLWQRVTYLDLRRPYPYGPVLPLLLACPHLGRLSSLHLPGMEVPGEDASELARSELLARLTELNLSGNPLQDEPVLALASSPRAAGLRSLSLSGCWLSDSAATAIARSPYLTNLVNLDLSNNAITDDGARALAASPHLSNPVVLNLAENAIGPAGREALLEAGLRHLRRPLAAANLPLAP